MISFYTYFKQIAPVTLLHYVQETHLQYNNSGSGPFSFSYFIAGGRRALCSLAPNYYRNPKTSMELNEPHRVVFSHIYYINSSLLHNSFMHKRKMLWSSTGLYARTHSFFKGNTFQRDYWKPRPSCSSQSGFRRCHLTIPPSHRVSLVLLDYFCHNSSINLTSQKPDLSILRALR